MVPSEDGNVEHQGLHERFKRIIRMRILWIGAPLTILGFAINNTLGNWLTSYLIEVKGSGPDVSRYQLSVYWAGLTFGRVFSSFPFVHITERVGNTLLVVALSGAITIFWTMHSTPSDWIMVGAAGFCLGPNTPGIISIVSARVSPNLRGIVISVVIGCGLIGATLGPLIFGVIVGKVGLKILPPVVAYRCYAWTIDFRSNSRKSRIEDSSPRCNCTSYFVCVHVLARSSPREA
ncbi:hypothetical protein RSAG8_07934, partial [Rhizoctonia solani AG-8 WAC10335]